jgi:hypothetical protein
MRERSSNGVNTPFRRYECSLGLVDEKQARPSRSLLCRGVRGVVLRMRQASIDDAGGQPMLHPACGVHDLAGILNEPRPSTSAELVPGTDCL